MTRFGLENRAEAEKVQTHSLLTGRAETEGKGESEPFGVDHLNLCYIRLAGKRVT